MWFLWCLLHKRCFLILLKHVKCKALFIYHECKKVLFTRRQLNVIKIITWFWKSIEKPCHNVISACNFITMFAVYSIMYEHTYTKAAHKSWLQITFARSFLLCYPAPSIFGNILANIDAVIAAFTDNFFKCASKPSCYTSSITYLIFRS